jgi:hypothetical protein
MAAPEPPTRTAAPPRLLLPTSRSDVRMSWHRERDTLVMSLWREGTCIASAPLDAAAAAEVAAFIVAHLGDRQAGP